MKFINKAVNKFDFKDTQLIINSLQHDKAP